MRTLTATVETDGPCDPFGYRCELPDGSGPDELADATKTLMYHVACAAARRSHDPLTVVLELCYEIDPLVGKAVEAITGSPGAAGGPATVAVGDTFKEVTGAA